MKNVFFVVTVVLMAFVAPLAIAQMPEEGKDMMMDKKEGMKPPMACPLMNKMGGPIVVATSDAGVVVVVGNTMTKYDQDLDVIAQVELKKGCDMAKGGCPMMMGKMGAMDHSAEADKDGAKTEEQAGEHQAHHAAAVDPLAAEPAQATNDNAMKDMAPEAAVELAPEPANDASAVAAAVEEKAKETANAAISNEMPEAVQETVSNVMANAAQDTAQVDAEAKADNSTQK